MSFADFFKGKKTDAQQALQKNLGDIVYTDINVLMVGARRCGKSSILASMKECMEKNLAQVKQLWITQTQIRDDEGALSLKQEELQQLFSPQNKARALFPVDSNASEGIKTYTFELKVGGKNTNYRIKFFDVPGEYFVRSIHEEEALELVRKSHVLMVAIDSPALMEDLGDRNATKRGYGPMHREVNEVEAITKFIQMGMQDVKTNKAGRLVLFVPVKCEKYYHNTKKMPTMNQHTGMAQLAHRVETGYQDAFDALRQPSVKDFCHVVIAPALTLKNVIFSKYETKIINNVEKKTAMYSYTGEKKYDPELCEQPLLHVLKFVLTIAADSKQNQNLFQSLFASLLGNKVGLQALQSCANEIDALMNKDPELGFRNVQ